MGETTSSLYLSSICSESDINSIDENIDSPCQAVKVLPKSEETPKQSDGKYFNLFYFEMFAFVLMFSLS